MLLLIEKICVVGISIVVYVNYYVSDKIVGIDNYLEMVDFIKKVL